MISGIRIGCSDVRLVVMTLRTRSCHGS
jgi:hypothetical protein